MAIPKMSETQWANVHAAWSKDERSGYTWLVRELALPVSAPAVRKRAVKSGWVKGGKVEPKPATAKPKKQKPETTRPETKKAEKPEKPETRNQKPEVPNADPLEWEEDDEGPGAEFHDLTLSRVHTQSLEDQDESPLAGIFEGSGSTKYHSEFVGLAYRHCLLGATPEDVATLLKVSEQTVYNWMKSHPAFGVAMQEGRAVADAKVASSLYKKATGFTHQATKVFQYQGVPVVVPYIEVVAPDTDAAKFWLTNRQPERWKNKVEVVEAPTIALVDKEKMDELYSKALQQAAETQERMMGRAERLGLTLEGDFTPAGEDD